MAAIEEPDPIQTDRKGRNKIPLAERFAKDWPVDGKEFERLLGLILSDPKGISFQEVIKILDSDLHMSAKKRTAQVALSLVLGELENRGQTEAVYNVHDALGGKLKPLRTEFRATTILSADEFIAVQSRIAENPETVCNLDLFKLLDNNHSAAAKDSIIRVAFSLLRGKGAAEDKNSGAASLQALKEDENPRVRGGRILSPDDLDLLKIRIKALGPTEAASVKDLIEILTKKHPVYKEKSLLAVKEGVANLLPELLNDAVEQITALTLKLGSLPRLPKAVSAATRCDDARRKLAGLSSRSTRAHELGRRLSIAADRLESRMKERSEDGANSQVLQALRTENQQLTKEARRKEAGYQRMAGENGRLKDENSEMRRAVQKDVEPLRQRVSDLEEERSGLKDRVAELEVQLADKKALEEQKKALEEQVAELSSQTAAQGIELETLRREKDELAAALRNVEPKLNRWAKLEGRLARVVEEERAMILSRVLKPLLTVLDRREELQQAFGGWGGKKRLSLLASVFTAIEEAKRILEVPYKEPEESAEHRGGKKKTR